MVMIRAGLTIFVAKALARAVTIAIRYSVVRRQTQNRPGLETYMYMCTIYHPSIYLGIYNVSIYLFII